jgi:hypothetical protein
LAKLYSFGIWDNWQSFVADAEEGLRLDSNGNLTSAPIYYGSDGGLTDENRILRRADWFEIDASQPALPQTQYENLTRFVNQDVLDKYKLMFENLETKMDMGGVLERDKLIPTSNPIGIFSFGLASPTLYRKVEFYVPDLDILVDGLYVTMLEMNGVKNYYTTVNGKQYHVWRQQQGTQDILNNIPNAKRVMLEDGMYVSEPRSGVGSDGTEYNLKFATKTKKIYLEKPKQTGEAQYIDLFITVGGNSDKNSQAFFAKSAPIIMLAEKLENAGVRTRIYACSIWGEGNFGQYTSDPIRRGVLDTSIYSYVAKEYGEKIDVDRIATLTNDTRLFRGKMIPYMSGLWRKIANVSRDAGGVPVLYGGDLMNKAFASYRNFLKKKQADGLFNSKVKEKGLMILSSTSSPDNDYDKNEDAIVEEFYRISDIAEMLLAKEPEKAIRRMVERDKKRGKSLSDIKDKLKGSVKSAFLVVTPTMSAEYPDLSDEVEKMGERESRIISAINKVIV